MAAGHDWVQLGPLFLIGSLVVLAFFVDCFLWAPWMRGLSWEVFVAQHCNSLLWPCKAKLKQDVPLNKVNKLCLANYKRGVATPAEAFLASLGTFGEHPRNVQRDLDSALQVSADSYVSPDYDSGDCG